MLELNNIIESLDDTFLNLNQEITNNEVKSQ